MYIMEYSAFKEKEILSHAACYKTHEPRGYYAK